MKYLVCFRTSKDLPTSKIPCETLEEAKEQVRQAAMQGVKAWYVPISND